MVVRAHKSFDCKGFDYVLSYYDNPESNVPKYAYNWLINYCGPYYLHQIKFAISCCLESQKKLSGWVHDAAKKLEQQRMELAISDVEKAKAKEPAVELSRMASGNEGNEKQRTDSLNISEMTEKEPVEENSKTVDIAKAKFEILSHDVRLCGDKPISSSFEAMKGFSDES
ncbi:StAR-related lipid transfer protein 7 [Dirofilaria immitis]